MTHSLESASDPGPSPPADPSGAPSCSGRPELVALGLAVFLTLVAWWPALAGMGRAWFKEGGYYSHGPLIPLICGWLVWRDRDRLRSLVSPGRWWALLPVGLGAGLLFMGIVQRTRALQQYGLVVALAGIGVAFVGPRLVLSTTPVFAYLAAFMIPLPGVLLSRLTAGMKLSITAATSNVLEVLGIPAVLRGDQIHFRGHVGVRVDDVCSGLRSMVALLAIAVLMAMIQRVRWKAALLVLMAVPVALLGNGARIGILSWLAARGTPAAPETFLHDLTGYLVYLVALGLLLALSSLPAAEPAPRGANAPPVPLVFRPGPVVGVLALLLVTAVIAYALPRGPAPAKLRLNEDIPAVIGAWTSRDLQLPPEAMVALKSTDYVFRDYSHPELQAPVTVLVLHSDASDTHPPDGCYKLQGFKELERGQGALPTARGTLDANRAVIEAAGQQRLVYFCFRIDSQFTTEQDRLSLRVRGFVEDLTFREGVAISTIRVDTTLKDGVAAAEERLARFSRELLQGMLEKLP